MSPRSSTSSKKSRLRRFSPRRTAKNSSRLRRRGGGDLRILPEPGNGIAGPSGRGALAAPVAARSDDATASLGGHARAESMTALTDELGRLIGTLHLF